MIVRLCSNPAVRRFLSLLFAAAVWPCPARAGASPCWYEAGVLVVPAEVMGVAGDYVLDTGAPATLLADTQAQAAGFAAAALTGKMRLAGVELEDRPIAVAKLDARLNWLPTPVAGVIGADVLRNYVVDVRFAPCRVALWSPRAAPRFGRAVRLPLAWMAGRPTVRAAVSDGRRAFAGRFVIATGSDTPVRLRDDRADAPGAAQRDSLYPYGVARPRLRAFSLAGDLFENLPSGLVPAGDFPADGEVGAPILVHWRLRFDFPDMQLSLAKQ
jgi:hypothetical protein